MHTRARAYASCPVHSCLALLQIEAYKLLASFRVAFASLLQKVSLVGKTEGAGRDLVTKVRPPLPPAGSASLTRADPSRRRSTRSLCACPPTTWKPF